METLRLQNAFYFKDTRFKNIYLFITMALQMVDKIHSKHRTVSGFINMSMKLTIHPIEMFCYENYQL